MITPSEIYWILKLDDIRDLSFFLGMSCIPPVIVFLVLFLASKIGKDCFCEDYIHVGKICGRLFALTAILTLFLHLSYAFIPSTKQMAMIKVIPMIANSEAVKTMSNDAKEIYTLGIKAIKEQLTGKE